MDHGAIWMKPYKPQKEGRKGENREAQATTPDYIYKSFAISLHLPPSIRYLPYPPAMSDEEHQFESKADAGASKTYPMQAGAIRKNGYIVIKNRPCKVLLHVSVTQSVLVLI